MKPDYEGNGIVNLMSSIIDAAGHKSPYEPLKGDALSNLSDSKNIVLIIIDGLGYKYLKDKGRKTLLNRKLIDSMTSVFLPSTGPAISTFFTGLAPQQHAVTGWYVHLQEFGLVAKFLPFTTTVDWNVLRTDISNMLDVTPLFSKIQREYHVVLDESISDSVFTRFMTGGAIRHGYAGLDDFFIKMKSAVLKPKERSYTYAYWAELDAIGHMLGMQSQETTEHLNDFDRKLEGFIEAIQGTDTTLIITADHGFNDVKPHNNIYSGNHPKLTECLTLPLCGDSRTAFCYVKPSMVKQFEKYVTETLGNVCDMFRSEELVNDAWFGLMKPSSKLRGRIGDYTLIFKDGYGALNSFPGISPPVLRGHHGGITDDEMKVPLVVIDC
ncbi:MAG: alkaline phosphatase family protein [Candidatus Thorarchaeota archaeon]